jgi:hypothetical protein
MAGRYQHEQEHPRAPAPARAPARSTHEHPAPTRRPDDIHPLTISSLISHHLISHLSSLTLSPSHLSSLISHPLIARIPPFLLSSLFSLLYWNHDLIISKKTTDTHALEINTPLSPFNPAAPRPPMNHETKRNETKPHETRRNLAKLNPTRPTQREPTKTKETKTKPRHATPRPHTPRARTLNCSTPTTSPNPSILAANHGERRSSGSGARTGPDCWPIWGEGGGGGVIVGRW